MNNSGKFKEISWRSFYCIVEWNYNTNTDSFMIVADVNIVICEM